MTYLQSIVLGLLAVVTCNNLTALTIKPATAISQLPTNNSSYTQAASTTPKLDRSNFVNNGADAGKSIRSTVEDSNPMSWEEAERECLNSGGAKLIWNKNSSGQSLKTCIN